MSGNGTEFTSNVVLRWGKEHQVEWHYIAPGKLMQKGHIEFFDGRMRDRHWVKVQWQVISDRVLIPPRHQVRWCAIIHDCCIFTYYTKITDA